MALASPKGRGTPYKKRYRLMKRLTAAKLQFCSILPFTNCRSYDQNFSNSLLPDDKRRVSSIKRFTTPASLLYNATRLPSSASSERSLLAGLSLSHARTSPSGVIKQQESSICVFPIRPIIRSYPSMRLTMAYMHSPSSSPPSSSSSLAANCSNTMTSPALSCVLSLSASTSRKRCCCSCSSTLCPKRCFWRYYYLSAKRTRGRWALWLGSARQRKSDNCSWQQLSSPFPFTELPIEYYIGNQTINILAPSEKHQRSNRSEGAMNIQGRIEERGIEWNFMDFEWTVVRSRRHFLQQQ